MYAAKPQITEWSCCVLVLWNAIFAAVKMTETKSNFDNIRNRNWIELIALLTLYDLYDLQNPNCGKQRKCKTRIKKGINGH